MEHKVPRDPKRTKKEQSTTSKTVLSSLCLSFWAVVLSKGTEVKAHHLSCRLCWQVDLHHVEDEKTAASSTKQREPHFSGWFGGSLQPAWVEFWLQSWKYISGCDYSKRFNLVPFSLPVRDNGLGSCLSVSAAECDQPEAAAWIGPCP